jgi:hypothetical protein
MATCRRARASLSRSRNCGADQRSIPPSDTNNGMLKSCRSRPTAQGRELARWYGNSTSSRQ